MAITINTQISGQQATGVTTYCYLYEPLNIVVSESNLTADKLYINLVIIDAITGSEISNLLKYGEYDINPGTNITIDIMKLAQQHHNAGVFKFSDINSIVNSDFGAVTSKYIYAFDIYSTTSGITRIKKKPIIGGRLLEHFIPAVSLSQVTNEFEYYSLNQVELRNKWNHKVITTSLVNPTLVNSSPTISSIAGTGKTPCGGFLTWKSRFGGWMFWGFDLKQITYSKKYNGNLKVGMFESTEEIGGDPYIPVDYTSIDNSYSINLKSLSLSSDELLAVSGINASPAIYFSKPGSEKLELMRLGSASVPISSLSNGGDFSVSLKSISKTSQKTK